MRRASLTQPHFPPLPLPLSSRPDALNPSISASLSLLHEQRYIQQRVADLLSQAMGSKRWQSSTQQGLGDATASGAPQGRGVDPVTTRSSRCEGGEEEGDGEKMSEVHNRVHASEECRHGDVVEPKSDAQGHHQECSRNGSNSAGACDRGGEGERGGLAGDTHTRAAVTASASELEGGSGHAGFTSSNRDAECVNAAVSGLLNDWGAHLTVRGPPFYPVLSEWLPALHCCSTGQSVHPMIVSPHASPTTFQSTCPSTIV